MEVALHFAERKSRLQPDADGRGIDQRAVSRVEDRRRNAIAVRNRIVGGGAPAILARAQIDGLHHRRRVVTRPDHHGDAQRELIADWCTGS
jgi:hypothetical protein